MGENETAGGRLFAWTPDDSPGKVHRVGSSDDLDSIHDFYARVENLPLRNVLKVAEQNGVKMVVTEHRYIDLDYRSEHSQFYSTTFRRYPSVCHRLHFFDRLFPVDPTTLEENRDSYLGYSVMRPLDKAPVGRTVLKPPPALSNGRVCFGEDRVSLFGVQLSVKGMPFTNQDAQFLRCAHASEWMVLYHAFMRYGNPRRLPADIQRSATGGVVVDRQLPSAGLSPYQMLHSLNELGLSPCKMDLPGTRDQSRNAGDLSLPAILCRYVNSQLPPIVISERHAWVICGYTVEESDYEHDKIRFYRHDDAVGPYISVDDPWDEPHAAHRPWQIAIPPLPKKVFLRAENAENLAMVWLVSATSVDDDNELTSAYDRNDLRFQTYAIPSNEFKRGCVGRVPSEVADLYRMSHWPRYIWVTEAVDKSLEKQGKPAVLGEVVIDGTAHQASTVYDSSRLAIHVCGQASVVTPDYDVTYKVESVRTFSPYPSGCPAILA